MKKVIKRGSTTGRVAPAPEPNGLAVGGVNTRLMLEEQVTRLNEVWKKLLDDPKARPSTVRQAEASLTSATRALAKVSGATDITPSQILRSRWWREIETIVIAVLRPHPKLLAELSKQLKELDARGV
jgi:hypothetical protein